jgi:L-threonylcarbamoyladenylate synthase
MATVLPFSENILSEVNKYLSNGKIIAFPTETVYALSCDATNKTAMDKLYQIKQRSYKQVYAILVADVKEMGKYAETDERAHSLAEKFSPGPLTYVLKAKKNIGICSALIKDGKIGVRIPDHKIAQKILQNYSKPLIATSVNFAKQSSALCVEEISAKIKELIDLIIDGGKCTLGIESTIVDLSEKKKITVLRKGYISQNDIAQCLDSSAS